MANSISFLCPSVEVKTMSNALGENVRRLREERGWKLRHLAERADMSVSYLWEIEKGRRKSPTLPVLERIANALGVSIDELTADRASVPEHAFHHVDRRHDPNAPIRPSLRERIRKLQDELGRLADELDELERD